ncbi:MAG: outer membrane protein assembly factor BamA [Gammaproteobacteria bacterium]|nr:outer membrane protein assembly factor BamA [Gammaproteobacteria bacterium]
MKLPQALLLCFLLWIPGVSHASFVIRDIQVEGIQRISAGTVFNYLPVSIGSTVSESDYPDIIRALFKTGFFTDVNLEQRGDVLVVIVTERPAIAEITITGNRDISTDDLKTALKNVGLTEGQVFDRALLEKVEQELLNQYFSRGKYAVKIDTQVTPLERNRVAITLNISEGVSARIRQINIVGNQAFTDKRLLKLFKLTDTGWLSFVTRDDRYSKQQLEADIENLRSFYLDRGYLKFNVDSTQVSITPDKKDIYITINITEGQPYVIKEIRLSGNLLVPEDDLRALLTVHPGDTFSRSAVLDSVGKIGDRLGDEGYALANINTVPELDEKNKEVTLSFVIDPGKRMYVRRIDFEGNTKTQDEVLRREMRQSEGSWFVTRDVNRSKERLERLAFMESVDVKTDKVPGTLDQVDIKYSVTEQASGNVLFGIGYGQDSGILLNASVNQSNFLGTGNQLNLVLNNSSATKVYSIAYNNPYYTVGGISRGFRVYYRERDSEELNTADYLTDEYGAAVNYGFPLNETDVLHAGLSVEGVKIKTTDGTPQEIFDYIDENGDEFVNLKLLTSFSTDTRNRIIFPERGTLNQFSAEIALPGGDQEFYKLDYRYVTYLPLFRSLIFSARADLGYGDGYGNTDGLPFYENYYAGGLRTVRGFKSNTLGPRYSDNEPSGGSFKVVGSGEVIFPVPFLGDSNNVRLSAFVDVGNVYADASDFDASELRYSTGLQAIWISPLGPLVLSVAEPLNAEEDDEIEKIQFSVGIPF